MNEISLIILAAGNSTRFNAGVKKQFLRLGCDPLWLYVTKNLSSFYPFKKIIISSNHIDYMKKFAKNYEFVEGGDTRAKSLKKALECVQSEFVMVSDAARVTISKSLFDRLIENTNKADCITPALKITDTTLFDHQALQREKIKLIQTPQISKTKLLKQALNQSLEFTDDSTAIAALGGKIWYVEGEENARKITFKDDLEKLNLPKPSFEIFNGNGFDVHEFGENRPLLLAGVQVHPNMGLKAHSDGDVLAHSLTDAILGAAGLGDIGELYPDTDMRFKNANSMELLKQAYSKAKEVGFDLVNIDICIMTQSPKLKDFKKAIEKNIANILDINESRVNVKATTTEKLGFIGRKEGMAVLSSVSLKYFDWTKL